MLTRFAPSPTGLLHLGHAYAALRAWDEAQQDRGTMLLRLEDIDATRCREHYETAIFEDLAWLGFVHDGPIVRQSERDAIYRKALQPLIDRELVFGCTCSRAEIEGRQDSDSATSAPGSRFPAPGSELRYPGTCRDKNLPLADDIGWRVRMEPGVERFFDELLGPQEQDPSLQCGDLLVRDRHGNWTYQFAVTVDDWRQGIDLVIRGMDLLESTGRQIRLARLLGRAAPAVYLHHRLIMKTPGQKLSKSDGDTAVRELRARGWNAADVRQAALSAG